MSDTRDIRRQLTTLREEMLELASAIAPGETVDYDTLVSLAEDGAEALKHLGAIQQTESKLVALTEENARLQETIDRFRNAKMRRHDKKKGYYWYTWNMITLDALDEELSTREAAKGGEGE